MSDPEDFDAFYRRTRDRLLLQTFALTGDLGAARGAVRETYVAAWHHWRKLRLLEDPEDWARPRAWDHAARRHTARIWHREKGLPSDARDALEALGELTGSQRRLLLLVHLVEMAPLDAAREVGLSPAEADRELARGAAALPPDADLAALLGSLEAPATAVRLPRSSILRRAGTRRRRTHTVAGVAVAVIAVLVSGLLVTDRGGAQPTLERSDLLAADQRPPRDRPSVGSSRPTPDVDPLPTDVMLATRAVAERLPGRPWTEGATHAGASGQVMPCQRSPYADARGVASLVRVFDGPQDKGAPERTAYQLAEVSASSERARRAWSRAVGWWAGCDEPRMQLLRTLEVRGVGDRGLLLELRDWDRGETVVAGVARTGRVVTATVTQTAGRPPDLRGAARLLADAVDELCGLPDSGPCADRPRTRPTAPPPVGRVPGMVSEIDLPPVTGVERPWVGSQPRQARYNAASTRCDRTQFDGRFRGERLTNNITRTFLVPDAGLPAEFGLTQTVASLSAPRAKRFVERVRALMRTCPAGRFGTDVVLERRQGGPDRELAVWHVSVELSDKRTVDYHMAIARSGTAVSQLGFVPAPGIEMRGDAFYDLAVRALDRLDRLPAPRR